MVGEGAVKILQQTLLRNEVMFSLFAVHSAHQCTVHSGYCPFSCWSPSCCGEVVPKFQMYTHGAKRIVQCLHMAQSVAIPKVQSDIWCKVQYALHHVQYVPTTQYR